MQLSQIPNVVASIDEPNLTGSAGPVPAMLLARRAGATGQLRVRADSAYYNAHVVAAIRAGGAQFSVTARMGRAVQKAIAAIDENSWTPIALAIQQTSTDIPPVTQPKLELVACCTSRPACGRRSTVRRAVRSQSKETVK